MDYKILDKKIKGGHLLLLVTKLELMREDILLILSAETTTDQEIVSAVKNLKKVEQELFSAKLDLELMGIEVSRSNI